MDKLVEIMIAEIDKYSHARFRVEVTDNGYNLLVREMTTGKYSKKEVTPEELFVFIGQWLALS